ncbi:hypothetical protein HNQ35_001361 [Cerasibacillus quisquiliarum]|uniref:DUF2089 domain-containing protein n=1 Tax=Cerasibacillus quisquiliarum TaxID=227865 RepID=A0A511UW99_9BACI|nr:DUF2089 domain-containing protein [Cerasibacillus quisquiliarum]MBB5146160.1 hypothetical protein [Cerasibacillus quisquiliarum]GEN30895.1 hypothetical protein CQU01_11330 [Cerasibacillus quisquiliarum]
MEYPVLSNCPVCRSPLVATKLKCRTCQTTIENSFTLSKFSLLNEEQLRFIEIFLVNRGNIKVVEKELGISYPTVRNKLKNIISILGYEVNAPSKMSKEKVVSMLEKGEISPDEAIELLKE